MSADLERADSETLLAAVVAEMHILQLSQEPVAIALGPIEAFQLCGLIQLALRHPDLVEEIRETGCRIVDDVLLAWFQAASCPAIVQAIRRGNDPSQDLAFRRPRILLP